MAQSPGQSLKTVRERLQIEMREVQEASMIIAAEEGNENFYISPARLAAIERDESVPNFYKLYSLCSIYGLNPNDLLSMYGVPRSERRLRLRRAEHRPEVRGPDVLIKSLAEAKRTYEMAGRSSLAEMRDYSLPLSYEPQNKSLVARILGTLSFWKAVVVVESKQLLRGFWRRPKPKANASDAIEGL